MSGRPFRSILILILALALVISACACGSTPSGGGGDTPQNNSNSTPSGGDKETPSGGNTVPPGGDNTVPPGGDTEPTEEIPDISSISCLNEVGLIEAIVPAADRKAVVSCWTGEFGHMGSVICVVDLKEDRILAQSEIDDGFGEPRGVRPNGEIVSEDIDEGHIFILSPDLKLIKTIETKGRAVYYDGARDLIYVSDGKQLFTVSPEGEEETVIRFGNWTDISEADPAFGTVLVTGRTTNSATPNCFIVYSLSGERLAYWEYDFDVMAIGSLAGNGMIAQCYEALDEDPTGNCALVANGITELSKPKDGPDVFSCSKQLEINGIAGCRYAVASGSVYTETGGLSRLLIFDLATGESYSLPDLEEARFVISVWDPASECFLIGASGDEINELLVVRAASLKDPSKLDRAELPEWPADEEITDLPEHLAEARALADEIEAEFGVKVLISKQADVVELKGFGHTSTSTLPPAEESKALINRLTTLKKELSVYKAGYFDVFKTDDGRGGLRIVIYNGMAKDGAKFTAGGVFFQSGAWYNLALDLYNSSGSTVHHELWHAAEQRAEGDGVIMDDEVWKSLNPDGFSYCENVDTYIDSYDPKQVIGAQDMSKVYFTRAYATINGKEDRATIIDCLFDDNRTFRNQYELIQKYPHIKAKLDRMAELIEPVFGYVYWEELYKNR